MNSLASNALEVDGQLGRDRSASLKYDIMYENNFAFSDRKGG